MKNAKVKEYYDMLGVELAVGDFVACPRGRTTLVIARIVKFTPKMAVIRELGDLGKYEQRIRLNSIVKVAGEDVLHYALRNNIYET